MAAPKNENETVKPTTATSLKDKTAQSTSPENDTEFEDSKKRIAEIFNMNGLQDRALQASSATRENIGILDQEASLLLTGNSKTKKQGEVVNGQFKASDEDLQPAQMDRVTVLKKKYDQREAAAAQNAAKEKSENNVNKPQQSEKKGDGDKAKEETQGKKENSTVSKDDKSATINNPETRKRLQDNKSIAEDRLKKAQEKTIEPTRNPFKAIGQAIKSTLEIRGANKDVAKANRQMERQIKAAEKANKIYDKANEKADKTYDVSDKGAVGKTSYGIRKIAGKLNQRFKSEGDRKKVGDISKEIKDSMRDNTLERVKNRGFRRNKSYVPSSLSRGRSGKYNDALRKEIEAKTSNEKGNRDNKLEELVDKKKEKDYNNINKGNYKSSRAREVLKEYKKDKIKEIAKNFQEKEKNAVGDVSSKIKVESDNNKIALSSTPPKNNPKSASTGLGA